MSNQLSSILQFRRWTLTTKLVVAMTLLSFVSLVLLIATASLTTTRELEHQLSNTLASRATIESERVGDVLLQQVNLVRAGVASDPAILETLNELNALYEGDADAIEAQLLELDDEWRSAGEEPNALINQVMMHPISDKLRLFIEQFPSHAEIFITDRYGAEIAGSGRTSDYYQADEDWWQAGWNDGQGAVDFGSPELDESSGVVAIDITIPIIDPVQGDVIGVIKSVYNINALIADTNAFTFGQSGQAQIIDRSGRYIVGPTSDSVGTDANEALLLDGRLFQEASFDLDAINADGEPVVIGFAPIASSTGSQEISSLGWVIRIEQDRTEAYLPISQLQTSATVFTIIAAGIAAVFALFFARSLTQDLKNLASSSMRFGAGNLKARATIQSHDEIGQLAQTFNQMADSIEDRIKDVEEARAQAERSDQVKSAFLASMSHELRTPLNAVINFTKFVAQGDLGPVNEEQQDTLMEAVDSAKHLLNLINDVLDMSKIESDSLNLFIQDDIDLSDILDNSIKTAKALIEDKPIEINSEIAPNLPTIRGDRQRIRQILLNILSNACKFTEEGYITVRASRQNDMIQLAIEDTGLGIAEVDQGLVFEAFKQTNSGLRQAGGTGLGMPISKNLVEIHGGKIWLESKPDEGTTFYFTLPIKSEKLTPIAA